MWKLYRLETVSCKFPYALVGTLYVDPFFAGSTFPKTGQTVVVHYTGDNNYCIVTIILLSYREYHPDVNVYSYRIKHCSCVQAHSPMGRSLTPHVTVVDHSSSRLVRVRWSVAGMKEWLKWVWVSEQSSPALQTMPMVTGDTLEYILPLK